MKTIKVVAAIIIKGHEVFATERGYGEFKGKWEFPGGKVEEGETKESALKREIMEELDAKIEIDDFLMNIEWDYPSFHLDMDAYICHLLNPHLELLEAKDAIWLEKNQLQNVDWLPADRLLLDKIEKYL